MKIAYVINSLEGGGTTAPLPSLFEVMRAHGATIRVFSLARKNGLGAAQVEEAGVEYEVCEPARSHFATLHWLQEEVAAWKPDLLWTSLTRATLLGQIVGQRQGVPVVSWQHNLYLKRANAWLLRLRRARSALWIADSDVVADMAASRLKMAPEHIVTWPIFRADPAVSAAPRVTPPFRLGSLGRLHPAKGYDLLCEAIAGLEREDVPEYRVCIAGTGARQSDLVKKAEALRITHCIELVGHQSPDDFLSDLDLYLQPSRREGFGIAAHEAMAAGLPVIVSDTGEMARSLRAANGGMVVPIDDVDALATALRLMLSSAAQWPAMAAANRDYVQKQYSADAFAAHGDMVMKRVKALIA